MLKTVVETPSYLAQAQRVLTAQERLAVVLKLARSPQDGVVIPGSGGLRKMRVGIDNRGARSGGRVIYWAGSTDLPVVLLWVYAKNAADDLTPDQTRRLRQVVDLLEQDFARRR